MIIYAKIDSKSFSTNRAMKEHRVIFINVGNRYSSCLGFRKQCVLGICTSDSMGGRGNVDFEEIIRALNRIAYHGPLSVEWEDSGMDREHGAAEACTYLKEVDFEPSAVAFDAAFAD